jgi:hypothetical protein
MNVYIQGSLRLYSLEHASILFSRWSLHDVLMTTLLMNIIYSRISNLQPHTRLSKQTNAVKMNNHLDIRRRYKEDILITRCKNYDFFIFGSALPSLLPFHFRGVFQMHVTWPILEDLIKMIAKEEKKYNIHLTAKEQRKFIKRIVSQKKN